MSVLENGKLKRETKLFGVILLISSTIISISCVEEFDPPRIYPAGAEYTVNAGNNLTLRCEGKYPITWELPQNVYVDGYEPANGNISVSETPDEEYPYGLLLELHNVSVVDVGYYTCKFNTTENDDLEAIGKARRIYVFVTDQKILMVPMERAIFGNQYSSCIIPCRPSAPNVQVKLFRDNKEVPVDIPSKVMQNRIITYDKRIGFLIPELDFNDGDVFFKCEAKKDGISQDVSPIVIDPSPQSNQAVPKPLINDSSNGYATVGDDIYIECFADVEYSIPFSLSWTYPNKDALKENRIIIAKTTKQNAPFGQKAKSSLTVKNVTHEDQGAYECQVNLTNTKSYSVKFINVVDKGHSFINLSEPTKLESLTILEGKPFIQWKIKVNAFPQPQIIWYDNHHQEITAGWSDNHSPKFEIKSTMTETMLRINKITLADSGIYQVKAVIDKYQESSTLNLTLIVKAKPIVSLPTEKFHIYGTIVTELCTATGYPPPSIQWTFRPCITNEECQSVKEEQISTYNTKQLEPTKVASLLSMAAKKSGYLTCTGKNNLGIDSTTTAFLVADVDYGFGIMGVSLGEALDVTEGDNVSVTCAASFYNYTDQLFWFNENGTQLNNNSEHMLYQQKSDFSNQLMLTFSNIQMKDKGKYKCEAVKMNGTGNFHNETEVIINVAEPRIPMIVDSNLKDTDEDVLLGQNNVQFYCNFNGTPPPEVTWYKDDVEWNPAEDDNRISIVQNILRFQFIQGSDEGKYSCKASNRIGSTSKFVNVVVKNKAGFPTKYIAIIAVILILFLILITYLVWKIRKEKRIRKQLSIAGLLNFEEGQTDCLNPELGVDEQAELLPYDKKWEFPRDKLKLGKQLGSGAFGVVMKANAYGIVDAEEITTVAVKMVKKTAEPAYIKALASELKIMVHLGKHLNVVNLLGACTKNVAKRELLVIVEYCQFGNIHNYLLRHRGVYIDQVDHNTGSIDPALGLINRAFSEGTKSSGRQPGGDYRDNLQSALTAQTTLSSGGTAVSMAPHGDDSTNDCGLNSNGSAQPEWRSNYKGDYSTTRPLCTRDLLCWAFQVARGMDYLAQRKVLHGDLAARNILLADDNIVKICDFGLAKNMYKTDNYRKKGDGPLPVKWMAIESIRDRIFSTQSDVWSFGIVLWELFSLARTPYPGMEADEKLYNKLVEGYRMEKPAYANCEIYAIMLDCWRAKPVQRPPFSDLETKLGDLLEESVRSHYIDLNSPYLEMNNAWLAEKGQSNDYLAMMNAPDYGNLVSPSAGRDYVNAPYGGPVTVNIQSPDNTDAEGYLCMSPVKNSVIFSPHPTKNDIFDFNTPPLQRKSKTNSQGTEESANGNELIPMLSNSNKPARGSESDGELSSLPGFNAGKNPSVVLIDSKDNYVNMSQQKMLNNKTATEAFSNPGYIIMDNSSEKKDGIKNNQYDTSLYINS